MHLYFCKYSRLRNKHSPTLINFLTFFHRLRPYSGLHRAYFSNISIRYEWGLRLFFLPNLPGAMFIQEATLIPDSRVGISPTHLIQECPHSRSWWFNYVCLTLLTEAFKIFEKLLGIQKYTNEDLSVKSSWVGWLGFVYFWMHSSNVFWSIYSWHA